MTVESDGKAFLFEIFAELFTFFDDEYESFNWSRHGVVHDLTKFGLNTTLKYVRNMHSIPQLIVIFLLLPRPIPSVYEQSC